MQHSLKLIAGPGERPYVKYTSDGKSRIHIAFTDDHPRTFPTNSIYYMYYEAGVFHHADGTPIKNLAQLPIIPRPDADIVYDGNTSGKAWVWDVAIDASNHPVIVHTVLPTDDDHRYYYSRWDGKKWLDREMTKAGKWFPQTPAGTVEREPHYSGGIILDHEDPSIVYLSKATKGVFEIEKWTTPDGGATWKTGMVTSGSAKNNVRPFIPWPEPGTHPPVKMLIWMHGDYVHYTNFDTEVKYLLLPGATTGLAGGVGRDARAQVPDGKSDGAWIGGLVNYRWQAGERLLRVDASGKAR